MSAARDRGTAYSPLTVPLGVQEVIIDDTNILGPQHPENSKYESCFRNFLQSVAIFEKELLDIPFESFSPLGGDVTVSSSSIMSPVYNNPNNGMAFPLNKVIGVFRTTSLTSPRLSSMVTEELPKHTQNDNSAAVAGSKVNDMESSTRSIGENEKSLLASSKREENDTKDTKENKEKTNKGKHTNDGDPMEKSSKQETNTDKEKANKPIKSPTYETVTSEEKATDNKGNDNDKSDKSEKKVLFVPKPDKYQDTPSIHCSKSPTVKVIIKYVREMVECSCTKKDVAKCAPYANEMARVYLKKRFLIEEPNISLFMVGFVNNLCLFPGVHHLLDPALLYRYTLETVKEHCRTKRLAHLSFSALANLAHLPDLVVDDSVALTLTQLVAPLYSESPVIGVWASAVGNIAQRAPHLIPHFLEQGTVAILERLLMFFGDDPMVLNRGLHCLSALCSPVIDEGKSKNKTG